MKHQLKHNHRDFGTETENSRVWSQWFWSLFPTCGNN